VTDLLAGRAQMGCGVSKFGARSRKMRICRWDPIFGTPHDRRAGIVSFNVGGVHSHDVAQVLDWEGVAPCAPATTARSP
jgi:hypothetical protein